ncbi:MAG: alpha/beta hydrolase [Solirubrobacteraceae bacterium]|nr:alpha/beta hydrolase [Patulibacter sp.]
MATFVLVPGAGADPRVYGATIDALERRGHHAVAPPLPLADPDATPSDHAAAIVDGVPDRRDVVVVAQSLGAFAGPIAAERLGATRLILLAPMIPTPGETAGQWWETTGHGDAIADLVARHGPMGTWGDAAMQEVFLHDVDARVARETQRYSGAPGRGLFTEPWPLTAWPAITTRVLAPSGDRLFPPAFQRRVARERLGLELDDMPGGHLPMLSRPDTLADRLVDLAG